MSTVDQSVIYQWAALVQYALITVIGSESAKSDCISNVTMHASLNSVRVFHGLKVAVVSYTTLWIFALAIPTVIIFLDMQQKYRLSARELKRCATFDAGVSIYSFAWCRCLEVRASRFSQCLHICAPRLCQAELDCQISDIL